MCKNRKKESEAAGLEVRGRTTVLPAPLFYTDGYSPEPHREGRE